MYPFYLTYALLGGAPIESVSESSCNLSHPFNWTSIERLLAAYFKNDDAGPLKLG